MDTLTATLRVVFTLTYVVLLVTGISIGFAKKELSIAKKKLRFACIGIAPTALLVSASFAPEGPSRLTAASVALLLLLAVYEGYSAHWAIEAAHEEPRSAGDAGPDSHEEDRLVDARDDLDAVREDFDRGDYR